MIVLTAMQAFTMISKKVAPEACAATVLYFHTSHSVCLCISICCHHMLSHRSAPHNNIAIMAEWALPHSAK